MHNSQPQELKRFSTAVPDNPPASMQGSSSLPSTKASVFAVMAAKFFREAGDAVASTRISDMVMESMKKDLAQESRFASDSRQIELHEMVPVAAAGDFDSDIEVSRVCYCHVSAPT
jgi:hypothetical protein